MTSRVADHVIRREAADNDLEGGWSYDLEGGWSYDLEGGWSSNLEER